MNLFWFLVEDWIGLIIMRMVLLRLELNFIVNDLVINKVFVSLFKSKGNSLKVIRSYKRLIV